MGKGQRKKGQYKQADANAGLTEAKDWPRLFRLIQKGPNPAAKIDRQYCEIRKFVTFLQVTDVIWCPG